MFAAFPATRTEASALSQPQLYNILTFPVCQPKPGGANFTRNLLVSMFFNRVFCPFCLKNTRPLPLYMHFSLIFLPFSPPRAFFPFAAGRSSAFSAASPSAVVLSAWQRLQGQRSVLPVSRESPRAVCFFGGWHMQMRVTHIRILGVDAGTRYDFLSFYAGIYKGFRITVFYRNEVYFLIWL